MFGLHFKVGFWPDQYVNIPVGPHRIVVIGRGRLDRRGRFHKWQPCFYYVLLYWCCEARIAQHHGRPVVVME